MLQLAAVLTTGGLLLFCNVLQIDPKIFLAVVNRIIDSKNLESEMIIDVLKINYLYDAVLGLVFVVGWRKEISLDHPKKLLRFMCNAWKNIQQKITWNQNLIVEAPNFNEPWEQSYQNWMKYVNQKDEEGTIMSKSNFKSDKNQPIQKQQEKTQSNLTNKIKDNQTQNNLTKDQDNFNQISPRERFLQNQKVNKGSRSPKQSPKKTKQERQWLGGKVSSKIMEKLDISKPIKQGVQNNSAKDIYFQQDEKGEVKGFVDSDQQKEQKEETNSFLNRWVGKFKNVVGDKKITRQDLKEVLNDFRQKLTEKNVAQEVAQKISEAVGQTLLQTKTKSFTSVQKTVKEAMKDALRKILTPKTKIDLVVEVTKQREKMKPYVIVFIGVNGVGKSTNLAKVAYKLKSAKLSVMLAACDNFRAGAVEQIKTHGRNLDIPVFDKGYKQQPANIAYEAIQDATKKRIDAVLIDTAGRMQDNAPLMKELARLVKLNKPNLIVFIGQALVGNGAVDQITKFNSALKEEATEGYASQIDGILLSKFDTVDDKVGTALSLVYATSKPILFVGVGQKYPNLKQLNVSTIVQSLLS